MTPITVLLAAYFLLFLTCLVFLVSVYAGIMDIRELRVPNILSVIVIVAFFAAYAASPETFGKLWYHLGAFAIMFGVSFAMYAFGMLGAGDTKFASALALWVGIPALLSYVFWMAVMGGVMGLFALFVKRSKPFANPSKGWVQALQAGEDKFPYGIAISFGAWAALLQTGFISHQLDELIKIIH